MGNLFALMQNAQICGKCERLRPELTQVEWKKLYTN